MTDEEIKKMGRQNKGFRYDRVNYKSPLFPDDVNREYVFYKHWRKQNKPVKGINQGFGILQDLFFDSTGNGVLSGNRMIEKINHRDRWIVATVIQWLGTNVGFAFLQDCLKDCGYTLTKKGA